MVANVLLDTPIERIGADAGHRVRDGHAGQAGAVIERLPADAGHGVRDVHARQAGATIERIVADAGHGISGSAVRDGFGNDHVASVSVCEIIKIPSSITDGQFCLVICPDVIDGFTISVRHLNVVCGRLDAHHAHEQSEQECNV